MDIELKRVILTRRTETKTFTLCDGLDILYYGEDYMWEDRPKRGTIKENNKSFTIQWEDGQDSTQINESEQSKSVLKYCGF